MASANICFNLMTLVAAKMYSFYDVYVFLYSK